MVLNKTQFKEICKEIEKCYRELDETILTLYNWHIISTEQYDKISALSRER